MTNASINFGIKSSLPQSQIVMIMGIISIISILCCPGIGIILAIIALVLSRQDRQLYRMTPEKYTLESFHQLKAGIILSWITVGFNLFCYLIFFIIVVTGNLDNLK